MNINKVELDWTESIKHVRKLINQVQSVAVGYFKKDDCIKETIEDALNWYDFYSDKQLPKTVSIELEKLYNSIIESVQFIRNCKDLGW